MDYRALGNTSLKVSKICLGTMTWGQQNSEADAHEQMDYAVDRGINFFDTAELYAVPATQENNGLTEQYIGTWFKKTGKRGQIVLATKIAGPRADLWFIRDQQLNYSAAQIRLALEGSLRRLQTDYVDLYQLHWPERKVNSFGKLGFRYDPADPWEDNFLEVLQTMEELKKAGRIRHFGLSNETPWGLMRCLHLAEKHGLSAPVSIQNPYSLLNRTFEVGLAECAIREKCGLLAYSPLAFGLLSGKYHKKLDTPNDRINQFRNLKRYNSPHAWKATEKYLALTERHGLSLAHMALAFVTQQHFTTATIIGATTMAQLKENIESAGLVLPDEMLKEIEEIHMEIPNPAP
ncbi:MAG: NADP(H)-dependent aldo-keto reductase [Saprospiraceae bacterium]|nr:NADP(H)-dependent aldo-keto reductase [Saprospiraceae bacterium]